MTPWTVAVAPVPERLEAPEAWALHGAAEVSRATDLDRWGYDDIAYTARYMLARLHEQQYATRVRLVATDAGGRSPTATDVVGTASLMMPVAGNARTAHLEVTVHPAWRRRGVGTALLAEADIVAAGHGYLCVAAEHAPSGRLVAFTMVEYPRADPAVVFQEDTLVVRGHRGHRLGMLVKATLLERLADVRPGARRIHTWNAEENEHMLAINVALGFRPTGVSGAVAEAVGGGGRRCA